MQRIRDDGRRSRAERALLRPSSPQPHQHQAPSEAPAASHAGPTKAQTRETSRDEDPGVLEHLVDAGQYLMHQQMPFLVLTTMLAFPLVVGVGGFLTAGGSPLLLAAIAALPGLSVLAVVAAMGREILLHSSEGEGDVPDLPEFGRLVRGARDFAVDAALVLTLFFAPSIFVLAAGSPWYAGAPGLVLGVLFAPLAFALRQIRRDMRALSPVFLLRAVRRAGAGYPLVALATTLAFAPAVAVAFAVIGHPVWVQVSILGPLSVLPVFATTRLLGTWLDSHREQLGYLMVGCDQHLRRRKSAENEQPEKRRGQRSVRRPEALERGDTPQARAQAAVAESRARRAQTGQQPAEARPTRRAIEGRRPEPRTKTPDARRPAARPAQPQRAQAVAADARPDLAGMPGAVVVSGDERARQGAASRRG